MMRRKLMPYGLQVLLLVLALVPIHPGVFLRGELLVPSTYMYDVLPWSRYRPPDLARQNPLGSEVPISVCVWYKLTDEALDAGEWPLWNPMQFTGAPLFANFQTAILYPPRLLFRLFDDTYLAMTVYILVRFWLCGFNAFVCARMLGLRAPYANFFSFAYMLAGYNLLWTYYPPPDAMAWLPLLFAATEFLLAGRYRRGAALMMFSLVPAILAGHPSSVMMGCVGLACYAILHLIVSRAGLVRAAKCAACAGGVSVLAFVVCAVQLLPFVEYLPNSELYIYRFYDEGVAHYTFSAFDLMSMWAPRILGTEFENTFWGATNHTYLGMLYVGVPVWVCALLLLAPLHRSPADRRRARILVAVSVLCVYCATNFPGSTFIQQLPLINGSRPAYFLAFPTLALPLLAASALQAWASGGHSIKDLNRPVAVLAAAVVLLAGGVFAARFLSYRYIEALGKEPALGWYATKQIAWCGVLFAAALLLIFLIARYPRYAQIPAGLMGALLVADQSIGIYQLIGTTPRAWIFPQTKLTDFLHDAPKPCRVRLDTTWIAPGYATLYGIEELTGYDAVYPKRIKPFLDRLNNLPGTPVDALLSCRYTLFPENAQLPPAYRRVATIDGVQVAENTRMLPRARLVGRIQSFASSDAMFAEMEKGDFDPESTVFTDVPVEFQLPTQGETSPGAAKIVQWDTQSVTLEADAASDCVLVLADAYYPGWEAAVDGQPARIFPAYHLFRGVHLSAGKHTVEFRYRPASFRYGLTVSFAALAVSGMIAAALARGCRERANGKDIEQSA